MRGSMAVVAVVLMAAVGSAEECPCPEPSPGLDPNYSRLLFGPTGRPLARGEGSFSDYELLFPGVDYGVTDHFSIAGGVSVIPGLGLDEQVQYVAPKLGWNLGEHAAVSVGGLYARIPAGADNDRNDSLGVAYAVGTFGGRRQSLSIGLGIFDASGDIGASPILMVGGTKTIARHVALVGETWIPLAEHFDVNEQPIGLGVRLFGDTVSADVGVILIGELLAEGLPAPWASITYHFGRGRARR